MHAVPSKDRVLAAPAQTLLTFLFIGVAETAIRYLRVDIGQQTPHVDVRCCWRPLAEAVLAGTPIYIRPAIDNKPPLFEFLNIAVAATGEYLLVFYLVIGLVNGLAAVLLWRVCVQRGAPRIGLIAGLLFIATVPIVGGTVINVRSFAVAGILLSLAVSNPVGRGVAVGAACLFSQHAVFAIPILAYDRLRTLDRDHAVRWFVMFALGGISIVVATFGSVYVIWGAPSLFGAVKWSFLKAAQYTTNPVVPSLFGDTWEWGVALYLMMSKLFHLLIPATLIASFTLTDWRRRFAALTTNGLALMATLLALSLSVPLLIRAYRAYWLYPLPFLSLLASIGYHQFFNGRDRYQND